MSRNVFNSAVSSIECLALIGNDAGEIKENQEQWLRLHHVCVHTSMCVSVYVCLDAFVYVYVYICVYIM